MGENIRFRIGIYIFNIPLLGIFQIIVFSVLFAGLFWVWLTDTIDILNRKRRGNIMKMYINFDNETKKVDVNVVTDEFGNELDLCDAMPYIMDALYDLIVKDQKRKMMR